MRAPALLSGLVLAAFLATAAAAAAPPPAAEVRLGVLWADLGPSAGRLPGADLNGELLFTTPLTAWTLNLPAWLRWAAAPRVNFGGTVNTAGAANQAYTGLTWTLPLASSLLRRSDTISFGFSVGPDLLGGNAVPTGLNQGPQLRLGAELGYQVTPEVGVFLQFDHVTSGAAAREGDSLNELGLRVGLHF